MNLLQLRDEGMEIRHDGGDGLGVIREHLLSLLGLVLPPSDGALIHGQARHPTRTIQDVPIEGLAVSFPLGVEYDGPDGADGAAWHDAPRLQVQHDMCDVVFHDSSSICMPAARRAAWISPSLAGSEKPQT